MAVEYTEDFVAEVLLWLDEQGRLFPKFVLQKKDGKPIIIGSGGFSTVYGMSSRGESEKEYALKITGFQRHTLSSDEFWNTTRIQWILAQESPYVAGMIEAREIELYFDENGKICEVRDILQEGESGEMGLRLQMVLMDRLDTLTKRNRFGKTQLLIEKLTRESEIVRMALEIGQAIVTAHNSKYLHRDIKLENIFYDAAAGIYRLGDFGISRRTEDGFAETIVYTDGYGAPEIEKRLLDTYNATVDIYSFGITLYLLLNELRFPGSDGYYCKMEIQYNPEFVFPAPVHASEKMARILRKMTAYYPEDRYQSMGEVLSELSMVVDASDYTADPKLLQMAELATQTYLEETEKTKEKELGTKENKPLTRAEKKARQNLLDGMYYRESAAWFTGLTILFLLLLYATQSEALFAVDWSFLILPVLVLFEGFLQKIRDLQLVVGAAVLVAIGHSVSVTEISLPHILLAACLLTGCPLLSASSSIATGLWIFMEVTGYTKNGVMFQKWEIGWLFLSMTILAANRYFLMRRSYDKLSQGREQMGTFTYRLIPILMIFSGFGLLGLERYGIMEIPEWLNRIHLVLSGALSMLGLVLFEWLDRRFSTEEKAA